MELENAPTAMGLDKITIDIIIIIIALRVKVPESVCCYEVLISKQLGKRKLRFVRAA